MGSVSPSSDLLNLRVILETPKLAVGITGGGDLGVLSVQLMSEVGMDLETIVLTSYWPELHHSLTSQSITGKGNCQGAFN